MKQEKKPLEDSLRAWLDTQGYPLELELALSFQNKGYRVFQSDYYLDPESGDQREIDILAYKDNDCGDIIVRISFVVECKTSRDKPWVLFTSKAARLGSRAKIVQRSASEIGKELLYELADRDDVKEMKLFKIGNRPAYGARQALANGPDAAYAAMNSVSKAASARATKTTKRICQIVFPLICIDGRLFEYFIAEDATKQVAEIKNGVILWRNPVLGLPHTIISVVTLAGLEDWLNNIDADIEAILSSCDCHIEKILIKLRTPALTRRVRSPGIAL